MEEKMKNITEIKSVSIASLGVYFSTPALRYIEKANIINLEQLFDIVNTPKFNIYCGQTMIYNELKYTIKLLRCKYLEEEPLVDINDVEISSTELYRLLGLSTRSYNCLKRSPFSRNAKEFFRKMRNPQVEFELREIRTLGNKSINEIIEKSNIVIDYYDNHLEEKEESSLVDNNSDNEISSLLMELKSLQAERKKLDSQIDFVIEQIEQKSLEQARERVLK